MKPVLLYTVGHSNRTRNELIALLREAGVQVLVDVRAQPGSRRNPQFSQQSLHDALNSAGMVYHHAGRQLGGRRPARAASPHTALAQDGLRGYADYMDTDAFHRAAAQLVNLARKAPLAVLCAERLPEHCHRSLIADYLTLQGMRVVHLVEPGGRHEHQLRPEARRETAQLVYDRYRSGALDLS